MNEIDEIQEWFRGQCDGDWEHDIGIKIETLDNPGWSLTINLVGTSLEDVPFEIVEYRIGKDSEPKDQDWYVCKVDKGLFKGYGGPYHLKTLIQVFMKWQKGK